MLLIASIVGAAVAGAGAVAAQLRPAARARRRARRALRRIQREERKIERLSSAMDGALKTRADAYAAFRRDERLRGVPVDELRSYGAERVRWDVLKEAGLQSVADLERTTRQKLIALDGIGETSTDRILEARQKLVALNADEAVAPPSIDADAPEELDALRAARNALLVRDELGPQASELARFEAALEPRFAEVRRGTSLIRAPFLDEEVREAAVLDADAIVSEVESADTDDGVLGQARTARTSVERKLKDKPTGDELKTDHERRFADYSSVLEGALSGDTPQARQASKSVGGLPDEIAARVEAFELEVAGLKVTLRGYQAFGTKYMLVQQRTLIGDEMGLGKTMEALAAMVHLATTEKARHFLVVAPASVIHNWLREIATRTGLTGHLMHGAERDQAFDRWRAEGGVAVTSFSTLRRMEAFQAPPAVADPTQPQDTQEGVPHTTLDMLIVDEAHLVKNPEAERTRTIASIVQRTARACFLTGTPLENKLTDFQSLVGMLQPCVAGDIGSAPTPTGDLSIGRQAFLRAVAPVYLRRNQRDVLHELPPRIDKEEWVELTPEGAAAYRGAVMQREIMAMRRTATLGDVEGDDSAKLERLATLLDEYREAGAKVLVFSFFLDVLEAVRRRFAPDSNVVGTITGAVSAEDRMALCDALNGADGHAVLLAQIQAGGVGLNLQGASAVVLMEPQWKPSSEEQAIARAHRMGQARTVIVHKLFTKDSVDERMKEVLAEKSELFDAFARESIIKDASSEATETSLTRRVIDAEVERLTQAGEPAAS